MTTEQSIQSSKAPYRVQTTTWTPNPKFIPGSFAATTRHSAVESTDYTFHNTLEAAQSAAAKSGGRVQALSASGKSYRPVK